MQTTVSEAQHILQKNLDYTFFSWSKQGGLNPINIKSASGVYLHDVNGKKYLDFSSQLMNVNIGHGNPAVTEAVAKQMKDFSFVAPSMATKERGELGEKLASITPGNLKKTFFTLGGAEAIENAIKLARLYSGRHKIITHYRSYHGATMAAISAGGDPRKLKVDANQVPNIVHVQNPYVYRCPFYSSTPEECRDRALQNMEDIIKFEGPHNVAAILIEGESGTSGCIKYPKGYWKGVKAIAQKYDILTISDEVMSGFGRTGKWFGVDYHEVEPDILCMAKGLTSGYLPMGAMIVNEKIAAAFNEQYLPLGLTYSAHTACCAAANAVLKVYEEDNLVEKAAKSEGYINEKMAELKRKNPSVGDCRNTGMLGVVEIVKNRITKEPMAPWTAKPDEMVVMKKVAARIRERGMFTFVKWNYIFVAPPLISTTAQIDEGFDIISDAISIADEHCV